MAILFTFTELIVYLADQWWDSIFTFFYFIANQNINKKCVTSALMQHAIFEGAISKKN